MTDVYATADMTDRERNELDVLRVLLAEHDAGVCTCGHEIGFGDIAYNNGETESGTAYSTIEIQCVVCDSEIAHIGSWMNIDDTADLLDLLEREDWVFGPIGSRYG